MTLSASDIARSEGGHLEVLIPALEEFLPPVVALASEEIGLVDQDGAAGGPGERVVQQVNGPFGERLGARPVVWCIAPGKQP
ncbi:hypothetical protein ACFWX5_06810 [[Kitasatospora] papulosa]|uniref:hypothetical protein n=1 Tax=[Kitasatospora] papulosa TaxID=1464011 RepID=UPI00369C9098